MTWVNWVTLVIAVLGAVLGIINTTHNLLDRRVRLRITPKWAIADETTGLAIDVCNLSKFPVVIHEIGFVLGRPRGKLPRRVPIPEQRIFSGRQGPLKIEPRDSASMAFFVNGMEGRDITRAYALTSTGEIAFGTSGALKQFIARGNKPLD